jgi:hypothetical protein
MDTLGKSLIIIGVVFIVVGMVVLFGPKLPIIGKLPGDFHIKKENFEVYIPLATGLLISLLLSGLLWVIQYFSKK